MSSATPELEQQLGIESPLGIVSGRLLRQQGLYLPKRALPDPFSLRPGLDGKRRQSGRRQETGA